MKEINSVIEDLEMLKNGEWVPDDDSINASIEMLETANNNIEVNMINFLDWTKSTNYEKSKYELMCMLKGKPIDPKVLYDMWKTNI